MSLQQAYRGGSEGARGWWLHFAYDEELVAKIKTIHLRYRAWDEDKKRWWISDEKADEVATWLPGFKAFLRQPSLF